MDPLTRLAELANATHIEITYPLGRREVVDRETYMAMSDEDLVNTLARALPRREVLARRNRQPRRAS